MVSEIQSLEKQASLLGNQLATDEEKIDKSLHVDGSRTLKEKAQLAFTTFKANQQIDRSRKQLMMLEKDMDRILFLSETSAIKESAEEISSTIL
jgi:phage antirepressor YoqD-like protein